MKIAPYTLLLALPLLAASGLRPAASPAFAVAEGTVLVKAFEKNYDVTLDSIALVFDGSETPTDNLNLSMQQQAAEQIELTDTYVAMGEGRPQKLLRSFVTLSGSSVAETSSTRGGERDETEESSELEGTTVLFTWDADAEEYVVTFHEEEGDDDLLDDLVEDTDLRGFLPRGEVAEGDSWDVEVKAFSVLFSPSGDVKLVDEDDEDENDKDLDELLAENLSGEATATYKGTREVDGVEVAVIEVSAELASEASEDVEQGPAEGTRRTSIELEVEGELQWNLKGGHFAALDLSASVEMSQTEELNIQDEHEMEQSLSFSGTLTFSATATPE